MKFPNISNEFTVLADRLSKTQDDHDKNLEKMEKAIADGDERRVHLLEIIHSMIDEKASQLNMKVFEAKLKSKQAQADELANLNGIVKKIKKEIGYELAEIIAKKTAEADKGRNIPNTIKKLTSNIEAKIQHAREMHEILERRAKEALMLKDLGALIDTAMKEGFVSYMLERLEGYNAVSQLCKSKRYTAQLFAVKEKTALTNSTNDKDFDNNENVVGSSFQLR